MLRTHRRSRRRPTLECLESRIALAGDAKAELFSALTTSRAWIDYAPSYDSASDPYDANPSDAHIRKDLTALYDEGWRNLVTYTLAGTYSHIPHIAKSVGFQHVIAGVYDPTSGSEIAAASSAGVLPYADGFVVGNEGLQDGRYTFSTLAAAVAQVQTATSKPVTTSEPGGQYYAGSPNSAGLLGLGDWLFPNIDYFLFPNPSTPEQMWTNVSFVYSYMLANQTTSGPVVAKEVFYPTGGASPLASDANQVAWYGTQAVPNTVGGKPFYFVWGEAFDQPWKTFTSYEPHMGLHGLNNADGSANPKPIIAQLRSSYTGTYAPKATVVRSLAASRRPHHTALLAAAIDTPGPANPTGTVRFFDGTHYLGTARVVRGVARLRVPLAAGRHSLRAVFEGTGRYRWSSVAVNRRVGAG